MIGILDFVFRISMGKAKGIEDVTVVKRIKSIASPSKSRNMSSMACDQAMNS